MNFNQRNSDRNNYGFADNKNSKHREQCWLCRPCRNNFPPEINWDCEDDEWYYKGFSKNDKGFDRNYGREEKKYVEEFNYDYDFDDFANFDRKMNHGKENKCGRIDKFDKDDKKDKCNNHHPQCRCQRNCFGFFRIFHC